MEKNEVNRLLAEILIVVVMLVIAIPICVNASSSYNLKKEKYLSMNTTRIDVSSFGEYKKITVQSDDKNIVRVYLILKITKFNDKYFVYLNNDIYDLSSLDYTEDDDYFYFNLGSFDIDSSREFYFKIKGSDKSYYHETLTYSFYTEGLL